MDLENSIKRFLHWESPEDHGRYFYARNLLKNFLLRADLSNRIRYDPVRHHVKDYLLSDAKILEVGSGSVGITRYLKKRVIGVDLDFKGPRLPYLIPVKSSATNLPLKDGAFDLVFCVDLIEHLPKNRRQFVLSEMLRVSKAWVIIGVPCGERAMLWEKRAWEFWERKQKRTLSHKLQERIARRGKFLEEHRNNGLPTEKEIARMIEDVSASPVKVRIVGNQSVILWYFLALANLRFSFLIWVATIVISDIMAPLLKDINWFGHYREFFIAMK